MNELKCEICGFVGKSLASHIRHKHGMRCDEYRLKYKSSVLHPCSESHKKSISDTLKKLNLNEHFREQNSKNQKNGGSHFTKKYWMKRGYTEEDAKNKISEIQRKNCRKHLDKNDTREGSCFCIEYWTKRGYTEEDAKSKISKIQSNLSNKSSKFKGCVRTDEQKQRISSSVKEMINIIGKGNWAKHFGKFNGRSKSEIGFYNFIKENIDDSVEANVSVDDYIVDVIKNKKIIEFYGDFWHANPKIFGGNDKMFLRNENSKLAREVWDLDEKRTKKLKNLGYDVLVIWESDWNKNKEKCADIIKGYIL